MKKYLLTIYLIICLSVVSLAQHPGFPDCIMLNLSGEPATSRSVTWRTEFSDSISLAEIVLAQPSSDLEQASVRISGSSLPWEEGSLKYRGHRVVLDDLIPNTLYAYRVGNGRNWSEWIQFKTSSINAEPFSFLYIGDVQNNIRSHGSRVLRQAYSHFPDAEFMLFVGDLVNTSQDNLWEQFFYSGGWMFGMMPSVATPGNHEYDRQQDQSPTFSKHWNQVFALPPTGPSTKFNNRVYYFDYQGVRFIAIDSPAMQYDDNDSQLILDWLDKVLAENPNRWSVVFTHFPVYNCSMGRDNPEYINKVRPIYEKYGVDLVLQGHDHTYCRGQNLDSAGPGNQNKPVYVVSVAGPKTYGLGTNFWSDRVASNTQLYQNISFDNNTMTYRSFTVTGELYDEFYLVKNKEGVNKFIEAENLDAIRQRTEIPVNVSDRYTEEDLLKYYQQYPPR